ncbi:MAG: ATP-dependent DNA helicase RecG [Phycisphaerales bacterium]
MPEGAALTLRTPVDDLPGVTPRRATLLRRLELPTLAHLLRHYPARYEHEAAESALESLTPNTTAIVSVRGEISATRVVLRGKKRFEAVLTDGLSRLDLCFFNALYLKDRIHPGDRIRVQGKLRAKSRTALQMVNPNWEHLRDADPPEKRARIRPVYPASEDLPSREIEAVIARNLHDALPLIDDHLPADFREAHALPSLRDAVRDIHAPKNDDDAKAARRRLAYDEFLLFQLALHLKRARAAQDFHAPALRWSEQVDKHIRARFPFTLTPGQEDALRDIVKDVSSSTPANRLIQGDVGSGKTMVALYAMLLAVASKHQACLMAPTELLAEQHYATLSSLLGGSSVRIALLTGSLPEPERAALLDALSRGDLDLVVGTHALLTSSVRFKSLALAVIDEQHRFGVHQRAQLREKSDDPTSAPHTLVMTATPIPRTLSLTLFGDLDISTIKGLPPGRTPVATRILPTERRDEAYDYLKKRLDRGEQAYIVVPAIDADDSPSPAASVRATLKRLEEGALQGRRLTALHGRLKRQTREQIMARFRSGQINVLIATTVIEVGVDVPNASVMIIEDADRFGMAQLHQLRGRVGRGSKKSLCVCIADPATEEARQRLKAFASTTDGFVLAEKDLALRGPGEAIGARQSGAAPFRVADLATDLDLLLLARRDAAEWIERSPNLDKPDESLLRARVLRAHGQALGLADVA